MRHGHIKILGINLSSPPGNCIELVSNIDPLVVLVTVGIPLHRHMLMQKQRWEAGPI